MGCFYSHVFLSFGAEGRCVIGLGLSRWIAEQTQRLRNILVIPLLATVQAIGLIGTRVPALFVLGIGLICFLSDACKFVFIHQMTDEADEIHLQNY